MVTAFMLLLLALLVDSDTRTKRKRPPDGAIRVSQQVSTGRPNRRTNKSIWVLLHRVGHRSLS